MISHTCTSPLEVSIIVDEYEQSTFLQVRAYTKLGNRSLSTLVAYISVALPTDSLLL